MKLVNQEKRANKRARMAMRVTNGGAVYGSRSIQFAVRSLLAIAALSPAFVCAQEPASGAAADDAEELAEVIVTGIVGGSEQRKLDASFAISTVNAEEIQRLSPVEHRGPSQVRSGRVGGECRRRLWCQHHGSWLAWHERRAVGFGAGGRSAGISTLNALVSREFHALSTRRHHPRMEALRGGPSPIFSQGQPGLTTNFVLREGGEETEGSVRYSVSDYDLHRIDAVLSGAISENFYYMIGGYVSSSPVPARCGFRFGEGPAVHDQPDARIRERQDQGLSPQHRRSRHLVSAAGWWQSAHSTRTTRRSARSIASRSSSSASRQTTAPARRGARSSISARGRGWDGSITGASAVFDLGDSGITLSERMSFTDGDANTLGWVPDGCWRRRELAYQLVRADARWQHAGAHGAWRG